MDASQLAQFLAPFLPYLLKGGVELAKSAAGELGENLAADAWEGLKRLAEKIRQRAGKKPALQEALADAQAAPTDPDALAALRLQLKKLLQEDPDLLAEAARLLEGARPAGATVVASGDRSVAIGGDVSGSVIVTGDRNRVQGGTSPAGHQSTAGKPRGITMIPVESSMIDSVGYDEETRCLQVVFNSGKVYCYEDVPPEVFQELLAAESKGRYMLAHIIDVYSYRRGPCRKR